MNPFVIAFHRIIYSIPLKWLLLGLAVFGVLFASFSKADFQIDPLYVHTDPKITQQNILWNGVPGSDVFCIISTASQFDVDYNCDGNPTTLSVFESLCVNKSEYPTHGQRICISNGVGNYEVGVLYYSTSELDIPFSSLQCQTEYNLIPVESVDQNYCTTNNLCPAGGTPSDCPNVGVSNLYINDIFHPGAFNIIMNIPEEIDWDYAYTNSGQNFNIDVVGYNQDFEAIEGWIETNNYKPTSEDFTNIFTNFSNFGGLLIGALFVILVFYFVKKIFK